MKIYHNIKYRILISFVALDGGGKEREDAGLGKNNRRSSRLAALTGLGKTRPSDWVGGILNWPARAWMVTETGYGPVSGHVIQAATTHRTESWIQYNSPPSVLSISHRYRNMDDSIVFGTKGQTICRPSTWVDVLKFFVFNYGLHVLTIVSAPGGKAVPNMIRSLGALLLPFSGTFTALDVIHRFARGKSGDLQTAHKAGALCMFLPTHLLHSSAYDA